MEMIKTFFLNAFFQVRRVLPDFMIFILIIVALMFGLYKYLPAPVQAVMMKALLVSCGFLHAHITRKIAFPAIVWDRADQAGEDMSTLRLLIIVLYVVIIYAYASGG